MRNPWISTATYTAVTGCLLLAGYIWRDLRWDPTGLAVLVVIAWLLWLSIDRANLLDYAEQAADDSDNTARALAAHVADHHQDVHPTEPIPDAPATEPMERAWDTAAQQLTEEPEWVEAKTLGGRTFRFRAQP